MRFSRTRIMADAFTEEDGRMTLYTILKITASETKYNTGYNSRLGVKHFVALFHVVAEFSLHLSRDQRRR